VRKAVPHLPVAEHIADGLLLAKQEAVEEARAGVMESLQPTLDGTESLATEIRDKAVKIQTDAAALGKSAAELKADAERAAGAAEGVQSTISTLEVTVDGVQSKGTDALQKICEVVSGIAARVTGEVERVVQANVAPMGGQVSLKRGAALLQYVVNAAENAQRARRASAATELDGAGMNEALAEGGADAPLDAFKANLVRVLATISATVTKAGLEQASDAEVEAEEAGMKEALAEGGADAGETGASNTDS
jgi:hypothetical protein